MYFVTLKKESRCEKEAGWNFQLMTVSEFVSGPGPGYTILCLCAVGFVLLIACTNVMNLLFARSTIRQGEYAIRVALGATRSRLVRHALVESVLLGMAGMLAGLLLGSWWISLIRGAMPPEVERYIPGWHLPGGGVEVGESFGEALRRELAEEGRIEVLGEPVLHGLFFNSHVSRRDHVAVYVVGDFSQDRLPEPNREIVACGFFDAAALPAETTDGTRRRIAEVLQGKPRVATWR